MIACAMPRCPRPGHYPRRCDVHRQSTAQRGYGREWQRARRAGLEAACERCASTFDLTVDHIVPRSLGGSDAPSNLRTLCRSCHATIGVKSTSRRQNSERYGGSDTCDAFRERYS